MPVPDNCVDLPNTGPDGCHVAITQAISDSLGVVGGVAAAFGTIQLISIIFAAVVIKFFKPNTSVDRDVALVGSDDI